MPIGAIRALARRAPQLLGGGLLRTLSSRGGDGGRRGRGADKVVINERVGMLSQVRLVDPSGRKDGVMSGREAFETARLAGLDVMQVSTGAPPVVKLVDYAEMIRARKQRAYQKAKEDRAKSARSSSTIRKLKQVRLSPATDAHDREMKLRQARTFLRDGHRVRVFMIFRRGHGRLRSAAEEALAEVAFSLAPDGKLRGVEDIQQVRQLFKDPEPDANEPEGAKRARRPLELMFDPLSKRERDKAAAANANAAAQRMERCK